MLERICLLANYNLYGSKRHFTAELAAAFTRSGVDVKLIDTGGREVGPELLEEIRGFAPQLTASFNSILPNERGYYLWDFLKIPHLAILVDPAIYSVNLAQSPYSIVSCVDFFDCEVLQAAKCENSFFLPHGVDADYLTQPLSKKKSYQAVFIGSYYDCDALRKHWREELPAGVSKVLDDAIEVVLSDGETPFMQALVTSWKRSKLDPSGYDFETLCSYVDNYSRGYDRLELLKAIEDVEVHVFGDPGWMRNVESTRSWVDALKGQKNIVVHPSVSYDEGLEVLRNSAICLNSMPFFKHGTHERIFNGLGAGCLVITSDNMYIRDHFGEVLGVMQYRFQERGAVNEWMHTWLADEERREAAVSRGRRYLAEKHTWDQRAEEILEKVPAMIESIAQEHYVTGL